MPDTEGPPNPTEEETQPDNPDTEGPQSRVESAELRAKARQLRQAAASLDRAADDLENAEVNATAEKLLGGRQLIDAVQGTGEFGEAVVEPGEAVHYREVLARLRDVGVSPRGKSPPNTLLSALVRSPYFSEVGRRTGIYRRHQPEGSPV